MMRGYSYGADGGLGLGCGSGIGGPEHSLINFHANAAAIRWPGAAGCVRSDGTVELCKVMALGVGP